QAAASASARRGASPGALAGRWIDIASLSWDEDGRRAQGSLKTWTAPLVGAGTAGGGAFTFRPAIAVASGPACAVFESAACAGQGPPTKPPARKPVPVYTATRWWPSGPA